MQSRAIRNVPKAVAKVKSFLFLLRILKSSVRPVMTASMPPICRTQTERGTRHSEITITTERKGIYVVQHMYAAGLCKHVFIQNHRGMVSRFGACCHTRSTSDCHTVYQCSRVQVFRSTPPQPSEWC